MLQECSHLVLLLCLFVRPYNDQSVLDIATSEEMRELLTSPVKQSESATNGNLKQLDSGIYLFLL